MSPEGRRRGLAAAGIGAAALVVGVCVTVAFGLATGFERSAREADLPDVIVRFDPARQDDVAQRIATLPNLASESYRYDVNGADVQANGHRTRRGVVQVVGPGRRGYGIVDGRDVSATSRRPEAVVEQGLASEWHIGVGTTVDVGRLGPLRIVGISRAPDNVAFPLATAPRVSVGRGLVDVRVGRGGPLAVNRALLWLHDRSLTDVTLTQARAQSYGIGGVSFLTRDGVHALIAQAAGVVIALLIAFALVALGAAGVMLGTAAHADVRRRLAAIAVRRALGFSRSAIARGAAARAALVALPAAALGVAIGWALAVGPTGSLLAILDEAPPGAAVVAPLAACWIAIVALVVAAAAWPAWRITAGSPAALLRGGELAGSPGRGGGIAARLRSRGGVAPPGTAGRLRRRGGVAPPGTAGGQPVRRTRIATGPWTLGPRLVLARRARAAGTILVLGACAAVVLLMLALATTLERLRDDPSTLGKRYALTVTADRDQLPTLRAIPGVAAASPRWVIEAADSFQLGEALKIVAFPGDHTAFEDPPLAAGRRVRADDEAEVGVGLADALGLAPGGTLALALPGGAGEARFRVVGIVRALDNQGRIAYVRPARLGRALTGDPPIAVRLDADTDRATVQRRLDAAGFPATVVSGAAGNSAALLGLLGAVLRVVGGVVALVVLYALVQALALTAAERTRTLALLRTLGASRATVAAVLAGAGVAIVLPACVLAIALEELVLGPLVAGFAAGYADLPVRAGAGQAALVTVVLVILALPAGWWVARRLDRQPLAALLRERP